MNALVVLNYNNYAHPRSLQSMGHAAQRWKCEFVQIVTRINAQDGSPIHCFWQKTMIPFVREVRCFDRIAFMDADILVRDDCPSLFDQVAPGTFGAVSCHQPPGRPRPGPRTVRFWSEHLGLPLLPIVCLFNSGVLVYDLPAHLPDFEALVEAGRSIRWARAPEGTDQSALSTILYGRQAPMTWLPWTFNTCKAGRRDDAPLGPMRSFIYHFNGPSSVYPRLMLKCDWRTGKGDAG